MSTTIYMSRAGSHLIPSSQVEEDLLREIPEAVHVRVEIVRERSARQNRMFRALCDKVSRALNQMGDEAATPFMVAERFKMITGHYTLVPLSLPLQHATGERYAVITRSIAFHKMDQGTFNKFMNRVTAFTVTELLPHLPSSTLKDQIEGMLVDGQV